MKLSTVLTGCLVLVFSAVNTQAQECPDNFVIVVDCLDKNNLPQLTAVKEYAKLLIQHMPGTADKSTPRIGLYAVDDVTVATNDVKSRLIDKDATNKRALMGMIDRINADRGEIVLALSLGRVFYGEVFELTADNELKNCIVVIKDGSAKGITTDVGDKVHDFMATRQGKPMVFHFIRVNDTVEDDGMKNLTTWYNNTNRAVVDHPKSSYTDLTPQDAFNFVKDALHCVPFGKGSDTEEVLGGPSTASNYSPLSLTKTTLPGVVGLWSSVFIVATAASTF